VSQYDNERVQRMDADLDLLSARAEGLSARLEGIGHHVDGLGEDVAGLAGSIASLTAHLTRLVETVSPLIKAARGLYPVSGIDVPPAKDRKVWVAEVPANDEYGVGPISVMIEQFGDRAPSVAFRRERSNVWGRPFESEQR
jgi:hypothetical protein